MLQENQLFANRYRLVKRLGQGAFSEVWKAEDTKVGNLTVALKIYAPDKGLDEDGAKVFGDEFAIVFNVHHSNLLTPSTFDEEKNSPYLVLPFCEKGSATRLIGKMDERKVAQFLRDVSSALAYLHSKDIVHQDIKPDNVLMDGDGNFLVTDFGISTRMRSTLRRSITEKKGAGTRAYMGPERFGRNNQSVKASDVWSLGATLHELMSGDVPFGEDGGLVQMMGALIPEAEGDWSADLKRLVERCLSKETWDRPTAAQLRDISESYLRTGKWDLSPIDGGAKADEKAQEPPRDDRPSKHRPTQRKVQVEQEKDTTPKTPPQTKESQFQSKKEGKRSKILMWVTGVMVAVLSIILWSYDVDWKYENVDYVMSVLRVCLVATTFIVINVAFFLQFKQIKAKVFISILATTLFFAQLWAWYLCWCSCPSGTVLFDCFEKMMKIPILIFAIGIESFVFANLFGRIKWIHAVLAVSMLVLSVIFIIQ